MTYIRQIITSLLLLPMMILSSCADDLLYEPDNFGDGEGDLRATAEFKNLEGINVSRAGTPGNVINRVDDLWVVLYHVTNEKVEYVDKYHVSAEPDKYGYICNQTGNEAEPDYKDETDPPGSKFEPTAEPATPKATFTIKGIPFGKYKMYAVANVDLTNEDVTTEENLKSIQFKWDASDIAANNQMFGYFTPATDLSSQGFGDDKYIYVNKKRVDVHAWIKRLVSKVTVAFDTRNLKEAIWIYIKSVTIHDIPDSCYLGKDNTPVNDDQLIKNGQSIDYYDPADPDNRNRWLVMTKGSGVKGSEHANADNSLFFFENMQGDYEKLPEPERKNYLKEQIPDSTGHSIDTYIPGNDYKDRRRYGSYIEVIAYYRSQNTEKMSSGPIKYRFMLGKNITYNYDAERNYHYKLTLKFRGFANEADWHISYDEPTPSVYTPEQYYISYIYGQNLGFPVRILTGDENVSQYTLKAHIEENAWYPWDEENSKIPAWTVGAYDDINGFAWNLPAYNTTYKDKNYVGFLSLRQPTSGNLYQDDNFGTAANEKLEKYYSDNHIADAAYQLNVGKRDVGLYDPEENKFETWGNNQGEYTVKQDQDGSVTAVIPMYTRQKEMVPASDFTGNNPFPYYMRRAVVVFTLWDKEGKQVRFKDLNNEEEGVLEKKVPIMQVRRVENPKAIYRAHDNDDPFEVKLMHLTSASETSFKPFESQGAWRVSIVSDPKGLVKLRGINGSTGEVTNSSTNKYVEGSTGTYINFMYEPRGTIGENETRSAIIQVEYHDYTCKHLIFVRQGYHKGVKLGNANWSCYQVYATGTSSNRSPQFSSNYTNLTNNYDVNVKSVCVAVTRNPLSIGSFYKRNAYNYGFRESNNVGSYGWMKSVGTNNLSTTYLSGTSYTSTTNRTVLTRNATWTNVFGMGWTNDGGGTRRNDEYWADTWTTVDYVPNKKLTVPTSANFESLITSSDVEFGYGIAYSDGATAVAEAISDAYGYTDLNNTDNIINGVPDEDIRKRGVRACVVYNSNNGDNILFPLGAVGQGRRSRDFSSGGTNTPLHQFDKPGAGALSYSAMLGLLTSDANKNRPLTYNIYRDTGAVYWIKQPVGTGASGDYAGWDINYRTLAFNHYNYMTLASGSVSASTSSDALPIKLIYINEND